MKKICHIGGIAVCVLGLFVPGAFAGSNEHYLEEQRFIADNAFALVLAECGAQIVDACIYFPTHNTSSCFEERNLWQNKTFGEISANFSKDRFSYARFHKRGKTIFEQLKALPADHLEKVYQEHQAEKSIDAVSRGDWSQVSSATQSNQNVVVNYFLYHHIALRL